MDEIGFGSRERGLGVETHHVVEEREYFLGKPHTSSAQFFGRIRKSRRDRLIPIIERKTLWDAEPQSLKGSGFERPSIVGRHYRICGSTRGDGLCDRTDRIQGVGEWKRSLGRHPSF